ncbi:MAG: 3'-5' exonuclease [Bacteroidales bacterium]|jgi:DNA polymerase-3 subunit epsilon|nr:3'-5' exonuclease [Bacteroidales bacterium]
MQLNLTKPLVVFDLETTGIVIGHDRIIEVCMLKIMPDGTEEEKTMRINPMIPIPPEATAIHGIRDEDVFNKFTFKEVAYELYTFIGDADLCGFNSNRFDIPMLVEEFLRIGIDFPLKGRRFIDVQNIFHKMEPRSLKGAYKYYCKKKLVDNHSAAADTRATYEILKSQLDFYQGAEYEDENGNISTPIVNDLDALHEFSIYIKCADLTGLLYYNEEGKEIFNFGQYKGKVVEDIIKTDPSYFRWVMKADFPLSTKRVIYEIMSRFSNKA